MGKWLFRLFIFFFVLGLIGSVYLFVTAPKPTDVRVEMAELLKTQPGIKQLLVSRNKHNIFIFDGQMNPPEPSFPMLEVSSLRPSLARLAALSWGDHNNTAIEDLKTPDGQPLLPHLNRPLNQTVDEVIAAFLNDKSDSVDHAIHRFIIDPLDLKNTKSEQGILTSNAADLLAFVQSFLSNKIILHETLKMATRLQSGQTEGMGFGIYLDSSYGFDRYVWHGQDGKQTVLMRYFPGRLFQIILIADCSLQEAEKLADGIEDIYLGREVPHRQRVKAGTNPN